MVNEIKTVEQFESDVVAKGGYALVDFWAVWCRPCKMMAPVLDAASEIFDGKVAFHKVNVDEVPELAAKFEIMSIPNMIVFKDGKPIDAITGYNPIDTFKEKLSSIVG